MSALNGALVGVSTMLAYRTGIEECAIPIEEADSFTTAAGKVARHYNVETTQKTMDWIAFIGITGMIFGTRAVAVSVKIGERRKQQTRRGPATVHSLRPVVDNGPHHAAPPAGETVEVRVDMGGDHEDGF